MKNSLRLCVLLLLTAAVLCTAATAETAPSNGIPEALMNQLRETGDAEDAADSLLLPDGNGKQWCVIVTGFGKLSEYILEDGNWSCWREGQTLFGAEDIRIVRHTAGKAGQDGVIRDSDSGFDIVSASLDARMSYHWNGEDFVLAGWRNGQSWPGNVIVTDHSLRYQPDNGGETQEVSISEEQKTTLEWFDDLPYMPEEASARESLNREKAEEAYPGWTLQRYVLAPDGREAETGYTKIEDGRLCIRRAVFHSDAETETTDLLPVPVTASFRQRLETDPFDSLADVSGYGDTFLVPDAIDTQTIPVKGTILENEILVHALICLTENQGVRRVTVAEPDGLGGWKIRTTKPIPASFTLDLLHNGDNAVQFGNDEDFECAFTRNIHGEWNLAWVMGAESQYNVTWFGVNGYDDEGEIVQDYGTLPGSDLFEFEYERIPKTLQEAFKMLDRTGWAVVNNAKPGDRLHLREKPNKDGKAIGKFYNGTPVQIRETSGEWVLVDIGRNQTLTGWMMKKYLATGEKMSRVDPAFPCRDLLPEYIGSARYADIYKSLAVSELTGMETIAGIYENKKQSSWIVVNDEGDVSYVPVEWYGDGNG